MKKYLAGLLLSLGLIQSGHAVDVVRIAQDSELRADGVTVNGKIEVGSISVVVLIATNGIQFGDGTVQTTKASGSGSSANGTYFTTVGTSSVRGALYFGTTGQIFVDAMNSLPQGNKRGTIFVQNGTYQFPSTITLSGVDLVCESSVTFTSTDTAITAMILSSSSITGGFLRTPANFSSFFLTLRSSSAINNMLASGNLNNITGGTLKGNGVVLVEGANVFVNNLNAIEFIGQTNGSNLFLNVYGATDVYINNFNSQPAMSAGGTGDANLCISGSTRVFINGGVIEHANHNAILIRNVAGNLFFNNVSIIGRVQAPAAPIYISDFNSLSFLNLTNSSGIFFNTINITEKSFTGNIVTLDDSNGGFSVLRFHNFNVKTDANGGVAAGTFIAESGAGYANNIIIDSCYLQGIGTFTSGTFTAGLLRRDNIMNGALQTDD